MLSCYATSHFSLQTATVRAIFLLLIQTSALDYVAKKHSFHMV